MSHDGDPAQDRGDGPVRTLRLVPGPPGIARLADALHAASAGAGVRCVVLTGLGDPSPDEVDGDLPAAVAALASLAVPTVAVLAGTVAGTGLALACAADLRVMADDARLDTGTDDRPPQGGLSWTLPRLAGHGRASDLLLRPRRVRADEALALGLVTQVVPAGDLDAAASTLADELAAGPALVRAATKRSLAHGADDGLIGTMQLETRRAAMLRRSRG